MGRTRRRVSDQEGEELLTGYMRGKIHGYLVAKGCIHYNQIKRDLKLNNGTVSYHLRVLEKKGIIKSTKKGMKRYFYIGSLPDDFNEKEYSDMECGMATEIANAPGISATELARAANVSQASVTYYISKMKDHGLIAMKRKGMRVSLFIAGSADI